MESTQSNVLLILTGGTISSKPSRNGLSPSGDFLQDGMAPRPSFNDGSELDPLRVVVPDDANSLSSPATKLILSKSLRTPRDTYDRHIRYCVYEFETLLDSSSIDSEDWRRIGATIYNNYQYFDGFVVLHGTDTLAYTSSALSFMLQDLGKPVVLTGSQKPIFQLQNDAVDNLLGSMIVAGHFMIPEVCLFFNYTLFRGNRAKKISASEFAAFSSPNYAPLATVSAAGTSVHWHQVHRPTELKRFSLFGPKLDVAAVACLRIFPGIKPEMVDAVLKLSGLRGLILETFGSGNIPEGASGVMARILEGAVHRGVIVVNVTQCLSGNVSPVYAAASGLVQAGVIFGHDMTSESALTKLAYLLAVPGLSNQEIRDYMSRPLRGELTASQGMHFQRPGSVLTPQVADLTALGYAIMQGDTEEVLRITRSSSEWLLKDSDYLGNAPVHLAAAGPSFIVLKELLAQGASVHVRNKAGHTPLFLATEARREENVQLLKEAGAHLHSDEQEI